MFSPESEDLDKSISHSAEAILLSFDSRTELGSYVIEALFYLANALILRSRKLQQPGDVKNAIQYLLYLQDQSLETSNITCNHIKACLVCASAVQVEVDPVDPTRNIMRVATLFCELLSSGVPELLLIDAVTAVAGAICGTTRASGQPLPDEANECLRKARIRLPNLKQVRFALAFSLCIRFLWAHSPDDYEEATSIINEMMADPDEHVGLAKHLAGSLAWARFGFDLKPEHLAEAIFRIRTHLSAMSSEDPNRRSLMKDLADLEKRRFREFGVRSGPQEDNAQYIEDSHLTASPQMARSNFVGFPLPMPDKRDGEPHREAVNST